MLTASAGAGLKPAHYRDILEGPSRSRGQDAAWFEVNAENYMGAGGPPHFFLGRVRELYPVSLHGVGLSIGSAAGMTPGHLARLKAVTDRYEPVLVSEHLAWSTHDGAYLNDLLPLPYDEDTLALVARHVDEAQSALGRRLLIENPSTYLRPDCSALREQMEETEFLSLLARRTGCGLLLDVNNVFVSATNHGFDASAYLADFPAEHVEEIHLAGHAAADGGDLLIDTHDRPVTEAVWTLYRNLIQRIGPRPTLIEWDADIPAWSVLSEQVALAQTILAGRDGFDARAA